MRVDQCTFCFQQSNVPMAPHSCKRCVRDVIVRMAEESSKGPVEVNGVAENGLSDSPCKLILCLNDMPLGPVQ
jgi:hypothetical protein